MTARDQYDRLCAQYAAATEAGDAEAKARFFTEDAILLTPGCPPINGRQAIHENYNKALGNGYKVTIKVQDFQARGDTAYAVGTYEFEGENGKWLEVLHRQSDDSWLLHRVCSNVN